MGGGKIGKWIIDSEGNFSTSFTFDGQEKKMLLSSYITPTTSSEEELVNFADVFQIKYINYETTTIFGEFSIK
ncbi:MAG: hypothetical protein MR911_10430 [Spirochaetia bacterium]|nr:hypothetical protein [Spirochaetia bacterium]